jgi:hypothetical protein
MEMPSLMVIVPNTWGIPLAARIPASAQTARGAIPILQGVIVLWALATPTIGFVKSLSWKPTARNMARFGDR